MRVSVWPTVVAIAVLLSGCGAPDVAESPAAAPELATITVGALPIVDAAAVWIAMKKGYFAAEGLQVEVKTLTSGAAAVPGLANNEMQFAMGNYVSFFAAQASGALDLKLVADAYQAKAGMFLIMIGRASPIIRPRDLAGRKIAVNARANVAELTARSALETSGVDLRTVTFVAIPFPEMSAALAAGTVDAAFMVEPYVTQAEKDTGAVPLVDAASGPTANIPIAGWVTSARFARENPNTAYAFQRAILRGQADAADRIEVEQVVAENVKVDAMTVSLMNLGTWPTTLEATRIQRVIDLMSAAGQLPQPLDPRPLILEPAPR
ncbi:MAG TPA: ABC transporter substrate-binding protein [Actinophytocola sp.]|uniref:ABC transporter substrate-binding protein n=1 Tax=Actinophytocola sp. TaxID=1872138 RepID=UPI002DBCB3F2|nr:ABC transporter substrate-binding protein [Actinophytocola sp.]HEU5471564.1 ABC transporter substrate-binding protein [Actinophytocola sp.]